MNASDILKYGDITLHRNLADVPMVHWDTGGVCGWWSVKNIVSHLASYEYWLSEIIQSSLGTGAETPYLSELFKAGPEGFNDAQVHARQAKTPDEVLAEYDAGVARNAALILQVPEAKRRENGTIPWYGADYALDDYIVYTFYGHKREHSAQVAVFKDALNKGRG